MQKRWEVSYTNQIKVTELVDKVGVSRVIASLLVSRGVESAGEAARVLSPSFEQLHDPSLMLGMERAVARIRRAIDRREKILVYGDYDVDGTTSTVVLRRALQLLGATTGFHIPRRFTEGYGVKREVLERAKDDGYSLVISVDCGITAHEPAAWAAANGLDVIITDHHLPDSSSSLPPAFAVLNPNQQGCPCPDKGLAGVGVAFKLIHALLRSVGKEKSVGGFLKVVAIGTVADAAPLVGENRAIVSLGLTDLPRAVNPGLCALLRIAGCRDAESYSSSDIGFKLGPRINAAGRMDEARLIVELLETRDEARAAVLAARLDAINRERQKVQQDVTERAVLSYLSEGDGSEPVAVIAGANWHRGVVGIAASRLTERLERPCVVISLDGDLGHGSARSFGGYHILNGLESCADLLETRGGHAAAAGLTVRRENISRLRSRLNEHAKQYVPPGPMETMLRIDCELPSDDLRLDLCKSLRCLEPHGEGWPTPIFMTRGLKVFDAPRVLKDGHLKLTLSDGKGGKFDAVWWDAVAESKLAARKGDSVDVAYALQENEWQGRRALRLVVEDMRYVR